MNYADFMQDTELMLSDARNSLDFWGELGFVNWFVDLFGNFTDILLAA